MPQKKRTASPPTDHPGHGNGPSRHKDDGQDTRTSLVARSNGMEHGHLVSRGIGAGVRVTLRGTTVVEGVRGPVVEGDQVGGQHT